MPDGPTHPAHESKSRTTPPCKQGNRERKTLSPYSLGKPPPLSPISTRTHRRSRTHEVRTGRIFPSLLEPAVPEASRPAPFPLVVRPQMPFQSRTRGKAMRIPAPKETFPPPPSVLLHHDQPRCQMVRPIRRTRASPGPRPLANRETGREKRCPGTPWVSRRRCRRSPPAPAAAPEPTRCGPAGSSLRRSNPPSRRLPGRRLSRLWSGPKCLFSPGPGADR